MINKPVSFIFQPTLLELDYTKCVKVQMAIFRRSAE